MSVIDVGAWDGYYSFEAKRRGAARVLATDHFSWIGSGWGKKASFDLAKQLLAPEIEERIIDVPHISVEAVGVFDLMVFAGVFYHLRHPFYILERLAPVCHRVIAVETQLDAVRT